MSLSRNAPGALLDRLGVMGHPWHGLVSGGMLALPNGLTIPYQQPAGTVHWEYTAAHRVAVPGVPPVERTPDQAAADNLAGMQWRNTALISGGASQLYGRALGAGRWIWIDDAGDRWLVDASALHGQVWTAASVPSHVMLSLRRFGRFSAAPAGAPVVVQVPIHDLGQGGPELMTTPTQVTQSFRSSLFSIHPQGRAAAFMLHYAVAHGAAAWPSNRHPCGWFELHLSGYGADVSASIDVIADRLQTLGGEAEVTDDGDTPAVFRLWRRSTTTTTGSDYPTCSGGTETTDRFRLHDGDLTSDGYTPEWLYAYNRSVGVRPDMTRSASVSWGGMLWAVWYGVDGARRHVTLDVEWVYRYERHSAGVSDREVSSTRITTRSPGAGRCVTEVVQEFAPYEIACDIDISVSEACTYTWRLGGTEVASISVSRVSVAQETTVFAGTPDGTGNLRSHWTRTGSAAGTLAGAPWADQPASARDYATTYNWSSDTTDEPPNTITGDPGYQMAPEYSPGRRALWPAVTSYTSPDSPVDWSEARVVEVRPVRLGGGVVGFVRTVRPLSPANADKVSTIFGDIVTPIGAASGVEWSSLGPAGSNAAWPPRDTVFAAWCPATHQIGLRTQPACWV